MTRDAEGTFAGSWSKIGLATIWGSLVLVWWVIAVVAREHPGFLAGVPAHVRWPVWAIVTPLANVAVIASIARSLHLPMRRHALRVAFVAMAVTGVLALLLLPLRLEPHPFPGLGAFVVASVGTLAYWLAVELG
ncbi:MAG TPA: hypothetical protein VIW03_12010 [Anaeromyxobacter sp.]